MDIKKTTKNLPTIAHLLGEGWIYNKVLTEGHRGFLLTNPTGLIIDLHTSYGENLPQWELCFKHPKYNSLTKVKQIGCSLDKPLQCIADDLKNRLLNKNIIAEALTLLAEKKAEHQKNEDLKNNRAFVIQALSSVVNLEKLPHHSDFRYRLLDEDDNNLASLNHTIGKVDSFSFSASGLSAEKIIKIMQIINN